ncbi:hypothetical protein ES708_23176 [subsurface metagenome]
MAGLELEVGTDVLLLETGDALLLEVASDWEDIDGAITASYDDTGAPADGSGRYYRCVLNAAGAAQQISATDRGYRIPEGVPTTRTKTVLMDTLLRALGITETVDLDVILGAISTKAIDLDVLLRTLGVTETVDLDTLLKALGITKTVDLDVILGVVPAQTVALDIPTNAFFEL